jgi:hypothetical protein
MPRLAGDRGRLREVRWLLLLCLAAISASIPAVDVNSVGDEQVLIRAVAAAPGTALPPEAPAAANPSVDDLSSAAAAAPFRLTPPTARPIGVTGVTTLSLRSRVLTIVGERGPPPPSR